LKVGTGVVGGGNVAAAHLRGFVNVPAFFQTKSSFKLKTIADVDKKVAQSRAARFGFGNWTSDWRDVTKGESIQLVDVITPTYLHKEPSLDAIDHGKHVLTEKPLATNAKDSREMYDAARRKGVINMVGFNYRRVPMIALAKEMIKEGKIGKINSIHTRFLEDWGGPGFPLTWRMRKKTAGAGALADLGSHSLDLIRFFGGEAKEVSGFGQNLIRTRKVLGRKTTGKADVDDVTFAILKLRSGVMAEMVTSWIATGRKVGLDFEVYGEEGSLGFTLERPNELQYYSANDPASERGYRTIFFSPSHRYGNSLLFNAAAMGTGYLDSITNQMYDLLSAIEGDGKIEPSFYDGWQVNRLIDAIVESSSNSRWVAV
jgi:predicted dehydrogenase